VSICFQTDLSLQILKNEILEKVSEALNDTLGQ
jgi:hypothetical protein